MPLRAAPLAILVLALAALASCTRQTTRFAPALDGKLKAIDAAIARGETEVACAGLAEAAPLYETWAASSDTGAHAAEARALAPRVQGLRSACAAPPAGDPARLVKEWPALSAELRRISTYQRSGGMTAFVYGSMFAVAVGAFLLLRRKQPGEPTAS